MRTRHLVPVDVLDWYDGIVVAVVRVIECPETFLAYLVTWFPGARLRWFVLVPLDEAQEATLIAQSGEQVLVTAQRIVEAFAGDCSIIGVDDRTDEVVFELRTSAESIRAVPIADISAVIGDDRMTWLSERLVE